jgi:acyl-coenzyme A synthetase/AMP-(fatty) acid ligase
VGEEGQIVVRTDKITPFGMFCGYFKDEDLKKEVWHDDMYFTGDMAWRDEDGYFWFVGRADDVIKSSGYRIGPFEVESALIEHPAVMECAITAVPDPDRGQIVKASVILANGYTGSDALVKELQDHVKRVTAPYKYPRVIEFVTELPKTISGKIRRVEIRQGDMQKKKEYMRTKKAATEIGCQPGLFYTGYLKPSENYLFRSLYSIVAVSLRVASAFGFRTLLPVPITMPFSVSLDTEATDQPESSL